MAIGDNNGRLTERQLEPITLGVQSSIDDNRTQKHVLELRQLLRAFCRGSYSSEIGEFALVLRIGGKMQEFKEGCERIRRNRKNRYITVDVGFPAEHWRERSDEQIRNFLAGAVESGLVCCLSRLENDKTFVDRELMLRDFQMAKAAFLTQ